MVINDLSMYDWRLIVCIAYASIRINEASYARVRTHTWNSCLPMNDRKKAPECSNEKRPFHHQTESWRACLFSSVPFLILLSSSSSSSGVWYGLTAQRLLWAPLHTNDRATVVNIIYISVAWYVFVCSIEFKLNGMKLCFRNCKSARARTQWNFFDFGIKHVLLFPAIRSNALCGSNQLSPFCRLMRSNEWNGQCGGSESPKAI